MSTMRGIALASSIVVLPLAGLLAGLLAHSLALRLWEHPERGGIIFLLLVIVLGPLVAGVVLDLLFGTEARWWRWWYVPPLVVSLPGVALCVGLAVAKPYGPDLGWEAWIILTVLFGILPPMAMAFVGVGAGAGLRRWGPRSAAWLWRSLTTPPYP